MNQSNHKLLLVGWDAADWKVISPLMEEGKMPVLKRLVEQGASGNMATLHPVLSPMLWTSIATGKRPFKHGIYGFAEPCADQKSIRPITNLQRKTKAVWNILSQQGLKSNVVGWWPSHPAEPINGVMVSNHYQRAVGPIEDGWPMMPGTVYPARLEEALSELRFHPQEMTADMVLPFIPRAAEIDQDKDARLASFMKIFADCTSVHSAATWLMENEPWDFMAVYYDAIDHFSHGFMKYHPPRRDSIREHDFELYRGVVEGGYRYHDMMLGRLLELAGDDATVLLLSDHGFHPDHLRPTAIPIEPAGPAVEHRDFGIFVLKGPGAVQDQLVHGANLLDVAPTVLALFGLPAGKDMDGRVLVDALEGVAVPERIESWDEVLGDAGMHPPGTELPRQDEESGLKQLEALGYIEKADPDSEVTVARTQRELDYNLARAYMDAGMHGAARPLLEDLYRDYPGEYRFGIQLALCYRALSLVASLRSLVEAMNVRRKADAEKAREQLKQFQELKAEQEKLLNERYPDLEREERLQQLYSPQDRLRLRQLQGMAVINTFALDYLMGYVLSAEGRHKEALEQLKKAEHIDPDRPGLLHQIGLAYLGLDRLEEASGSFLRALEIDPGNPHVRLGLCRLSLLQSRYNDAEQHARAALGLMYFFPMAHYLLGLALLRQDKTTECLQAFSQAIEQNPNFPEAHARLSMIYRRKLGDRKTSLRHLEKALKLRRNQRAAVSGAEDVPLPPVRGGGRKTMKPADTGKEKRTAVTESKGLPVYIVSGLPRSGTSMVMQMLEAGGLPILSDGERAADEDNPRGYLEYEKVKGMARDASWLADAEGKAVKVIAQLLDYLLPRLSYRIIFLERNIDEVLASQARMLQRSGKEGAGLAPEKLKAVFERQLELIRQGLKAKGVPVLYLDYANVVEDPQASARSMAEFIGLDLDAAAMAAAVDGQLYRQRRA